MVWDVTTHTGPARIMRWRELQHYGGAANVGLGVVRYHTSQSRRKKKKSISLHTDAVLLLRACVAAARRGPAATVSIQQHRTANTAATT